MKSSRAGMIAAFSLTLYCTASAFAHTKVAETIPADGDTLEQSPPVIEIHFEHPVHLTAVALLEGGKSERKLEFTPHGSDTSFKLPNPDLHPGRNEIRWKALSSDGHVISGSLILVIDRAVVDSD